MVQIIAIGGGGFSDEPKNLLLDRYFLLQTKKKRPRVCFLGTASGDSDNYLRKFYDAFNTLDCLPTHLRLFHPHTPDIGDYLLTQDAIYVGGGSTLNMLVLWREWGIDIILRQAWEQGVVLGGVSAGAICWFDECVTDSRPAELSRLAGLGFLGFSACPHYLLETQRRGAYHRLLECRKIGAGFGIDDGAALHFVDRRLEKVVSSRVDSRAYHVSISKGEVNEAEIESEYLG